MPEIVLSIIIVPWCAWVTIGIFSSQKVEAVQESHYERILEKLNEIKKGINEHVLIDEERLKEKK
jgi:hypothetical protein